MSETNPTSVIAITTFRKTEKYLPLIESTLDRCWPDHPPAYCFSDGAEKLNHGFTLSYRDASWTEILYKGLREIKDRSPGATHVFHMLDDHCPLRACDTGVLARYHALARRRDLAAVVFPTYHWPWNETESIDYPDGLVRTWRKIEIEAAEGRKIAVVPRDFFRYFQVQPAFWNLDYLIGACHNALERGIRDAWAFEAMRWAGAAQHYVADYNWPTVHHGFLAAGNINPEAIGFIDPKVAHELRTALLLDSIGIDSPTLYRMWWASDRLAHSIAGRVKARLRKPALVRSE
jgi:hypothetical protein